MHRSSKVAITRPQCMPAMHRSGLVLQVSHVAWSVCLCVGHAGVLCKNGSIDRDAVWRTDSSAGSIATLLWICILKSIREFVRPGAWLRTDGRAFGPSHNRAERNCGLNLLIIVIFTLFISQWLKTKSCCYYYYYITVLWFFDDLQFIALGFI